uniref:Uncharacterized protein n=1 Tax=Meloidogyne hapla TaxID=6305 RepID=A0A1I8BWH1_MELHA
MMRSMMRLFNDALLRQMMRLFLERSFSGILTTNGNLSSTNLINQKEGSIAVQLEEPLFLMSGKNTLLLFVLHLCIRLANNVDGNRNIEALGAQKIIFSIQSASADTVFILKEYERIGK